MNFLQKGLAGLESRLDKVLLDEADQAAIQREREKEKLQQPQLEPRPASPARRSGEIAGKDASSARVTMQERLAAAMAKKAAGGDSTAALGRSNSVRSISEAMPRASIDSARENGRQSIDVKRSEPDDTRTSIDVPAPPQPPELEENGSATPLTREELEAEVKRLREDVQICESRRQEESAAASERVDALEEKLRYLARQAASAAHERAAGSEGLEKKVAEQEEKISLLIEEGEKLSKNELRLQNTIKRLRQKSQEDERAAADAKKRLERVQKDVEDYKEKLKRAQENERRLNEKVRSLEKVEKEVEGLRVEKENSAAALKQLKEDLEEQAQKTQDAESRVQTGALEKEKRTTAELKAQVERVQSEAALVEERLKSEVAGLKSKMARESEKARARESELSGEQAVMESKLEALRARLEEASSGATGDVHAKLLRQVETLQTQYAIASENWQGIESSLISRVASLEKERDDLAKKEGDIRRRAREMNLKSKTLEMDQESALSRIKDLESELSTQKELIDKARKRVTEAGAMLEDEKTAHNREIERLGREHQDELRKYEDASRIMANSRPVSPSPVSMHGNTLRKASSAVSATESYFLGFQRQKPYPRSVSAEPPEMHQPQYPHYPPPSRKSANNGGFRTPPVRQDTQSPAGYPTLNVFRTSLSGGPHTPDEGEDYFEGITPSSPHRHPDIVSVSTVAAGPSVQLVERMSANVRRLESEMSGSREELARMTAQRDEARQEIVDLMKEVGEKRRAEERADRLESELQELNIKMETSLELLGEKTEMVDELTADVADLKQMYRDLVQVTMK